MHALTSIKGTYLTPIYNLESYIRTLAKVFEPKRMQVFPLKLQYQKLLRYFFKIRSLTPCEFHII